MSAVDASTHGRVTTYVALGANLGDAPATVRWAVALLADLPGTRLTQRSSLYRTAPVESSGPDYINAVVELQTTLSPLDLLHALQGIEHAAGRERPYRNAPRTLDLDILLYGQAHIALPELTVPHPRMWTRAFVLQPLAELRPDLVPQQALQATAQQPVERL